LKYLVDTNISLEFLLEQDKTPEVENFLDSINPRLLAITDFSP